MAQSFRSKKPRGCLYFHDDCLGRISYLPSVASPSYYSTVQLYFELLDFLSDQGICDTHYVLVTEHMSTWIGTLKLEQAQENRPHDWKKSS